MLTVYTLQTSPRLDYILSTLLTAIGVDDWVLTTNVEEYINATSAKINYSSSDIQQRELQIKPAALLFEKGIQKQDITFFKWNSLPAFFRSSNSDISFDLFAASFYLISRYEEYLPHEKDMYARFAHEQSVAFIHKFLDVPLVNLWLMELSAQLTKQFPDIKLQPTSFSFIPTYDIDIAWSYLNKGWIRNLGGLLLSLVEHKWAQVNERLNVLFGAQPDPFDSYQWLDELHRQYNLQPVYFFLLARKNKEHDKHILPSKPALRKLVKQLHNKYKTGIHPSWQSGDEFELLSKEIAALQALIGEVVTKSRQHYIRMTMPETYRRLIAKGIKDDYSMGYGSINGFRASYCLPYKWYDLQKEQITSLTIHPFCFMDANAFFEQHLSTNEALQELKHYFEITKKVNGNIITIWHNHFLGTDTLFAGWSDVYKTAIERNILKGQTY